MSLALGVIAGLAFGLSALAGAFLAVPLLVLFVGVDLFQALPIALFALGICAAIAAGDAVRARQCDGQRAGWLLAGAVPAALIAGGLTTLLSQATLAGVFVIAASVSAALLGFSAWSNRVCKPLAPAALLHAPRRPLDASSHQQPLRRRARLALLATGAGGAVLVALCAAPGLWLGHRVIERQRAAPSVLAVGTLVVVLAVLAIIAAGQQFLLAPAVPGYTAGLYVLGAVAGMGLARRVYPMLSAPVVDVIVAVVVVIAALALWAALIPGRTGTA